MFQVPAAGEYDCEIVEITSERDGKARRVITWILRVIGGPHDGIVIEKKFYIVKKEVFEFLVKELKMLGIEPKTEADFASMKTQAYGKHVRISAVMNDQGFLAYYLKEVLDKKESQVAVGEQALFSFGTD
jgi:hypothetical protein